MMHLRLGGRDRLHPHIHWWQGMRKGGVGKRERAWPNATDGVLPSFVLYAAGTARGLPAPSPRPSISRCPYRYFKSFVGSVVMCIEARAQECAHIRRDRERAGTHRRIHKVANKRFKQHRTWTDSHAHTHTHILREKRGRRCVHGRGNSGFYRSH